MKRLDSNSQPQTSSVTALTAEIWFRVQALPLPDTTSIRNAGVSTDLSFDIVQQTGLEAGLVDVKICAVNEIWSGLKFVYRFKDRKSHH